MCNSVKFLRLHRGLSELQQSTPWGRRLSWSPYWHPCIAAAPPSNTLWDECAGRGGLRGVGRADGSPVAVRPFGPFSSSCTSTPTWKSWIAVVHRVYNRWQDDSQMMTQVANENGTCRWWNRARWLAKVPVAQRETIMTNCVNAILHSTLLQYCCEWGVLYEINKIEVWTHTV
eukprot:6489401-Amphidinium_carterae.1